MRFDSPFVLALAGTLAIHLLLVVAFDAVAVMYPYVPEPPAPRVELVDVEMPPAPPKPPPPPLPKAAEPEPAPPEPAPIAKPRAQPRRVAAAPQDTPRPTDEPPPPTDPTAPGGDEVVQMEDIAPAATGVAVKQGKRNTGNVGRGGSGGGTGAGAGSGAGDAPAPVSVATIKKPAMPKGDYSYSGTDYPAAAKQLGIEGPIRVRLIVDDQGKVKQATLLNRLGHGLDELALTRAKQIQFEPARDTDDRAVTSVVVWTFHMTLPN